MITTMTKRYMHIGPRCSELGSPYHDSYKCSLRTYYLARPSGSTSIQVDHGGVRGLEVAEGRERAAWKRRIRLRYRRREILGGGEVDRAGNLGVGRTDSGPMPRECQNEGKYWRGRRWGFLRAKWNGSARVQVNNAHVQGVGVFWTQDRQGVRG